MVKIKESYLAFGF